MTSGQGDEPAIIESQVNAAGNIQIDHQGDRTDTGGGDYVVGPKIVNNYNGLPVPAKPRQPYEPETVLIAAGTFLMGDDDNPLAAPQHRVYLPAYQIGCCPVTNEQFAYYIRATGRSAANELRWDGNRPDPAELNHPVCGVTWQEAIAYCDWLSQQTDRSYSLPNEAQWEKAARGTDGRLFPWGNRWEPARCHAAYGVPVVAVKAFEAQSAYGIYDMVGNAPEWTLSVWGNAYSAPDTQYAYPWQADRRNDRSIPLSELRVVRGGRGRSETAFACSHRLGHAPEERGSRANRIGFRVIEEVEKS